MSSLLPSRIASLVHTHFDALPTRSKPNVFPDGSREWIPMTGIVIVQGENSPSESLHCIAVTYVPVQRINARTGAKCLSASHMPCCRGLVLHDCHAEILAIRAFNHWLLTECHGLLADERLQTMNENAGLEQHPPAKSPFIRRRMCHDLDNTTASSREWPPFELQPNIKIYMYCTCAPCGDASMELCMAAQEDATPWEVRQEGASPAIQEDGPVTEDIMLDGRAHFSLLGIVRRKPARMDAESTRSKSCSDKLALRQVSSLLSCQTSQLIAPTENAYLAGLVLPEDEITRVGCERSFSGNGRMAPLMGRSWPSDSAGRVGLAFHSFQVLAVPAHEIEAVWPFAKPKSLGTDPALSRPRRSKPGTVSAVWTAAPSFPHSFAPASDTGSKTLPTLRRSRTGIYETIIGGVKQGTKASSPSPRGASSLSRAKLWAFLRDIVSANSDLLGATNSMDSGQLDNTHLVGVESAKTYEELKRVGSNSANHVRVRAEAIRDTKEVLKGWIPNLGDEDWGLEVLIDPKKENK